MIAVVNQDLCDGCCACENQCPAPAILVNDGKASIDPTECVGCGNCVWACTDGAITMH
jgi:NAD-dependent dihydropyrimidine dehydrogenase PreA subunit